MKCMTMMVFAVVTMIGSVAPLRAMKNKHIDFRRSNEVTAKPQNLTKPVTLVGKNGKTNKFFEERDDVQEGTRKTDKTRQNLSRVLPLLLSTSNKSGGVSVEDSTKKKDFKETRLIYSSERVQEPFALFSPDSKFLVVGGYEKAWVCGLKEDALDCLDFANGYLGLAAFSPNSQYLCVVTQRRQNGLVRLKKIEEGKLCDLGFIERSLPIKSVMFSSDGQYLLIFHGDDAEVFRAKGMFDCKYKYVGMCSARFSSDGEHVLMISKDGAVKDDHIKEHHFAEIGAIKDEKEGYVKSALISPDGKRIVMVFSRWVGSSGQYNDKAVVCQVTAGKLQEIKNIEPEKSKAVATALSPDGQLVVIVWRKDPREEEVYIREKEVVVYQIKEDTMKGATLQTIGIIKIDYDITPELVTFSSDSQCVEIKSDAKQETYQIQGGKLQKIGIKDKETWTLSPDGCYKTLFDGGVVKVYRLC